MRSRIEKPCVIIRIRASPAYAAAGLADPSKLPPHRSLTCFCFPFLLPLQSERFALSYPIPFSPSFASSRRRHWRGWVHRHTWPLLHHPKAGTPLACPPTTYTPTFAPVVPPT